jgi:hypothetical protein
VNARGASVAQVIGPWTRRGVYAAGVLGGALSAAAVVCPWFGVVGGVVAVAVLTYQHFLAGPVLVDFAADEWVPSGGKWIYEIPRARHGRRSPVATVGKWDETGRWTEVWLNPRVDTDSTAHLLLDSGEPFDGQVRIS